MTKALAEDPSIFEYDSVYDEMQQKKKKADPRLQKKDTKVMNECVCTNRKHVILFFPPYSRSTSTN